MKRFTFTWVAAAALLCSLKLYAQPDTLWTRTYDFPGQILGMYEQGDGELFVVMSDTGCCGDFSAAKLSPTGDSLWAHSFYPLPEMGSATSCTQLANANIVVIADSIHRGPFEIWQRAVEINQEGQIVSSVQLDDTTFWWYSSATPDGGVILAGSDESGNSQNILVQKLDENFEAEWTFAYGDHTLDEGIYQMDVDDEGRCLIVGNQSGYINGEYEFATLILLIDSQGELLWERPYDFSDAEEEYGIFYFALQVAVNIGSLASMDMRQNGTSSAGLLNSIKTGIVYGVKISLYLMRPRSTFLILTKRLMAVL